MILGDERNSDYIANFDMNLLMLLTKVIAEDATLFDKSAVILFEYLLLSV